DKLDRLTAVKKSLNGVIDLREEWKSAREGVDKEGVPISIFRESFEHEFPDVPLVHLDLRSEHQGSPNFRIELGKIDPKGFELHAYGSAPGSGGREGSETELRVAWS